MDILEVHSLNKLCHPLLDNIIANRRTIYILYVDKHEDQTHIKTLKRVLNAKHFSIKCEKLLSVKDLRQSRLFKQLILYDGPTVAMLLPSFYNKQEEDVRDIINELVIRKHGKELELIPVVFDNTCTRADGKLLQEFKPLKLFGHSSIWWEKLKPYFGRPVGEVHSWVVGKTESDDFCLTFQEDFDRLKLLLGLVPNDALPEALTIIKKCLDLNAFLLKHCCTNSPTGCGRWPTCPEISKEITRNFQTILDVEGVEDCIPYGSYRVQDISPLMTKHKESLVTQKPFPYSKETHICIIHNDDPSTLSKLNLMVMLLAIHGYKCITTQDIPAGENMLVLVAKAIKNSTATAVIDFCGLSKSQLAAAEFACMQNIKGYTKFISVYCNPAANTNETNGLGEVVDCITFPLDITYHHTKWLPKLLSMLEQPYHCKGVLCHFKSEKRQSMLVEIKGIAKKIKKTLENLPPKSERYDISLLIQDQEFVNFVGQAEYHVKEDMSSNSYPPTRNRISVPKLEENWSDDSASPSGNGTECEKLHFNSLDRAELDFDLWDNKQRCEEICSEGSTSPSGNGTEDGNLQFRSFGRAGLHRNMPRLDHLLEENWSDDSASPSGNGTECGKLHFNTLYGAELDLDLWDIKQRCEEICSDGLTSPSSNGKEDGNLQFRTFGRAGLHRNMPQLDHLLEEHWSDDSASPSGNDTEFGKLHFNSLDRAELEFELWDIKQELEENWSDDSASLSGNGTEFGKLHYSLDSLGLDFDLSDNKQRLDDDIYIFEPTNFSDDSIADRSADSGLYQLHHEFDEIYTSSSAGQFHQLFQRIQSPALTSFSEDSSAYYTESKSISIADSEEINVLCGKGSEFHGHIWNSSIDGAAADLYISYDDDDDDDHGITASAHRSLPPDQSVHLHSRAIQVTTASRENKKNSFDGAAKDDAAAADLYISVDDDDDDDDHGIAASAHRSSPPDQSVHLHSRAIQVTTASKENKKNSFDEYYIDDVEYDDNNDDDDDDSTNRLLPPDQNVPLYSGAIQVTTALKDNNYNQFEKYCASRWWILVFLLTCLILSLGFVLFIIVRVISAWF